MPTSDWCAHRGEEGAHGGGAYPGETGRHCTCGGTARRLRRTSRACPRKARARGSCEHSRAYARCARGNPGGGRALRSTHIPGTVRPRNAHFASRRVVACRETHAHATHAHRIHTLRHHISGRAKRGCFFFCVSCSQTQHAHPATARTLKAPHPAHCVCFLQGVHTFGPRCRLRAQVDTKAWVVRVRVARTGMLSARRG